MGFVIENPEWLSSLFMNRRFFGAVLLLICILGTGCDDAPSPLTSGGGDAQPALMAQGVRLETVLGGERVVIQGDHLTADDKVSIVDVWGSVRLQREPFGEVVCDHLRLNKNQGQLSCTGNVQGLLKISSGSVFNGDCQ